MAKIRMPIKIQTKRKSKRKKKKKPKDDAGKRRWRPPTPGFRRCWSGAGRIAEAAAAAKGQAWELEARALL